MRLVPPRTPAAIRLALMATALAWVGIGVGLPSSVSRAFADRVRGASQPRSGPAARAARSLYLVESANLRMVRGNEATISERGNASGTFTAPLSAQLTVSAEHVSAIFTIYPRGGSITGKASARFIVRGHTGYYGGTLRITHGTGAYRHASGTKLGISGTIDRLSFALTVKAHGWMKL
jgi:hypothetical protein